MRGSSRNLDPLNGVRFLDQSLISDLLIITFKKANPQLPGTTPKSVELNGIEPSTS